jgi:hypothetical protein
MSDLKNQILARISAGARSSVWTPNDFIDLGTYDAVRKTLQRLTVANEMRRIDDGLYDRPAPNPLTRQQNPPDARQVIDAIARRSQIRVLVDGMTAANDLGLTNAVPAKIIIHTDARLKPIKLGNLSIDFKHTAPSKLYWAGRPAMRVVQALHWLKDVLSDDQENHRVRAILKRLFNNENAGQQITDDLRNGLGSLPIWMQDFLRPLLTDQSEAA